MGLASKRFSSFWGFGLALRYPIPLVLATNCIVLLTLEMTSSLTIWRSTTSSSASRIFQYS